MQKRHTFVFPSGRTFPEKSTGRLYIGSGKKDIMPKGEMNMSMQQLADKKGLFVTNGDIILGNLVPDPHIDTKLTDDGLQFSFKDRWGCAKTAGMAFSAPMQIKAEVRSSAADFPVNGTPLSLV
jgi:hypothetical protein